VAEKLAAGRLAGAKNSTGGAWGRRHRNETGTGAALPRKARAVHCRDAKPVPKQEFVFLGSTEEGRGRDKRKSSGVGRG
jgi:hypothetical protein